MFTSNTDEVNAKKSNGDGNAHGVSGNFEVKEKGEEMPLNQGKQPSIAL